MDELTTDTEFEGKIDLEWDDDHVMPEVVNPDVEFLFRRMIEATLKEVSPFQGERVLDIGCGRATDGVELARTGAIVVGIEPSNVMISYAREHVDENGANMVLVQGVGEYLPFKAGSFDKVMCKGALDHFPDPSMVIREIAIVLKPEGEAIIAIANFGSLGFKLGKQVCAFRRKLGFKQGEGRMPWDIPPDHVYKFDYVLIRNMVSDYLNVKQAVGVSLLFGVPWWGAFLAKCPRSTSLGVLNILDKIARRVPSFSDVIVLRCISKDQ